MHRPLRTGLARHLHPTRGSLTVPRLAVTPAAANPMARLQTLKTGSLRSGRPAMSEVRVTGRATKG